MARTIEHERSASKTPAKRRASPSVARNKQKKPAAVNRRIGAEDSATRSLLVEAARNLMLEEGYAAVTSRRIAAKANLKPQLVHYYFRTMDELFLAMLEQGINHNVELLERALKSAQPLRELWDFNTKQTRLVVEFAALANHRPAIRAELAANADRQRAMQVDALKGVIEAYGIDTKAFPPAAVVVLITAVSRILAMEETVMGLTRGHSEMLAVVERLLTQLERNRSAPAPSKSKRR